MAWLRNRAHVSEVTEVEMLRPTNVGEMLRAMVRALDEYMGIGLGRGSGMGE